MNEFRVLKVYSNELEKDVRIYLFLPKSYHKSSKKYPVLYMHDGINLFDDKMAAYGKSWGIIEAYENNPNLPELVIVGVDTEVDRSDLLVPFQFSFKDNSKVFGGRTDLYLDFISKTLKPFIDSKYRTFKHANNTGIMGSSFGGVCSTYAAMKYSDYFSRFGCVSNAYYVIQKDMEQLVTNSDLMNVKRFYMDVGTKETSTDVNNQNYIKSNNRIYEILKTKLPKEKLEFKIIENAIHNESAWEIRFPDIINFLFN